VPLINKLGAMLLVGASVWAAPETLLWEPGKVVTVEQVSTPAKPPDPSCRAVPKGATPPARCRPSSLAAQHYWRVTVDVGNKRFVVRPYHPSGLLDSLNQAETVYVDPNLTTASPVEVAMSSSKVIRLRTDQGPGVPAIVDSQELLPNAEPPRKTELSPPAQPTVAALVRSASKVVLVENSDFRDLEVQELKSEEIGDGAVLYSFAGDSSQTRINSGSPVFIVLAETETMQGENLELSRLQVGQGVRQLVYSLTKKRSASSLPITVTQVSSTVRKINVTEPLPPGEYVVLLGSSNRGFLFETR
jgi:hypothetical protein